MTTTPDNASKPATAKPADQKPSLALTLSALERCMDLSQRRLPKSAVDIVYFPGITDGTALDRDIINPLSNAEEQEVDMILGCPPFAPINNSDECINGILDGNAAVFRQDQAYLVPIGQMPGRPVEQSETETVISGPHDGFVEDLEKNLSLIRSRLKSSKLKAEELLVGEVMKAKVVLVYLEGIADDGLIQLLRQRINDIEIDGVLDANMIVQLIDENPNSVFPQFLTTERPDAIISKLLGGRIVGIVDGSPALFSAPTAFFDFFSSPDDYYQRWLLGSSLRILRLVGFIITICFTAFYVSVTTFHYEMIPHTMLLNLTESRSKVPFPPLLEALLMETTIELLREAGARLPTKIGQTIGIVGGIVIGQAAVQAGFTSNILIIAVATSAIASFVIPSYIMSASLRLIRFGLIILAGTLGNLGLIMGIGFVIIHLAGITSLGTSYLTPLAPMSFGDVLDTFIRGPFWALKKRPSITKTGNKVRTKMRQ